MTDVTVEATDDVVDALEEVAGAAAATRDSTWELERRTVRMKQLRRRGLSWREIVTSEEAPGITGLISATLQLLANAGALLRRALARALVSEGLSTEQIGRLFGVSRQRISTLLRGRTG